MLCKDVIPKKCKFNCVCKSCDRDIDTCTQLTIPGVGGNFIDYCNDCLNGFEVNIEFCKHYKDWLKVIVEKESDM